MINKILEVEHQYVSCVTTSDTLQSTTEWIETLKIEEETLGIEEMLEETLEMTKGIMRGTLEKIETMKNKGT